MSSESNYSPLTGGLDEESPSISVPPGRVIAVENYEAVSKGYLRIEGYERFDGRASPSAGADAAAIAARRAAITAVPGSGPVRGVVWLDGKLHSWRDNGGATAGIAYQSSAGGWTATDFGTSLDFDSGGLVVIAVGDTITGATSGATATVRHVFLTEETYWDQQTASGTLILDGVTGVFQDDEALNVGAEDDVATVNGAPYTFSYPAGGRYEFVRHNFYGSVGTERLYGVNGVGKGFEFDGASAIAISTGMPDDRPFIVGEHKNHLFYGFRLGSVQFSSLGEPRMWCPITGAAEIGMGKELTNFVSNATTSLIVTTDESIAVLSGNDSSDFRLDTLSDESGAYRFTARRLGKVLYMDAGGVRSAASAGETGNFKLGTYTALIQKTLKEKRDAGIWPVASMVSKEKDQYILFFDDGSIINIYMGRKNPEAMKGKYPFIISCLHVAQVNGVERIFAGATNGFVYELNIGKSFDGADIEAWIQLPFGHEGGPETLKRYFKALLEMEADPGTSISVTAIFDYSIGIQPYFENQQFVTDGAGGAWGDTELPTLTFNSPTTAQAEAYIDGAGKNMSLVIHSSSATQSSHTLQGVHRFFSARGKMR
tara:strand:- start:34056 stop:35852 length:1797 start_codon:yes stop_codon:yes gene_type:complete